MDWIESTGKSVEEAIENGMLRLSAVSKEDLEIEVIDEGSKGFLGILGNKFARVRLRVKETSISKAKEFLESILDELRIKADIIVKNEGEYTYFEMVGENLGIIIGRRGETLDSLQYLTNLVANRFRSKSESDEEGTRIILDAEGYRRRRENTLRNLALRLAERVKREKRKVILEPMNPMERRIIHTTLQDNAFVRTHSEGSDPFRRVVITMKD